jgi:hypothetical protein
VNHAPNRRAVLAAVGAAAVAGCLDASGGTDTDGSPTDGTDTDGSPADGTDEETPLPADCPTSQDLGVEWPSDLDADAVEAFVEDYEAAYYREIVVDWEPEARIDAYELSGTVRDGPTQRGAGYVVTYSGSGGVYRPNLHLRATTADAPEGADVASADEIEDDRVAELIAEAADGGEAELFLERPDIDDVDAFVDQIAALSSDFETLAGPGDEDSLYVDADGTTVKLTVQADNFHGDYWWTVRYYVTGRVVRRTEDAEADPTEGTLLECRETA